MAILHLRNKRLIWGGVFLLVAAIVLLGLGAYSTPPYHHSQNDKDAMMAQMRVDVALEGVLRYKKVNGRWPLNAGELFVGIQLLQPAAPTLVGWANRQGELIDPWGNLVQITRDREGVVVECISPDHKHFTSDRVKK